MALVLETAGVSVHISQLIVIRGNRFLQVEKLKLLSILQLVNFLSDSGLSVVLSCDLTLIAILPLNEFICLFQLLQTDLDEQLSQLRKQNKQLKTSCRELNDENTQLQAVGRQPSFVLSLSYQSKMAAVKSQMKSDKVWTRVLSIIQCSK